jgi:hypothetical protein
VNSLLAVGSWNHSIDVWDTVSGEALAHPLTSKRLDQVSGIAWAPDGRTLASANYVDGSVILWDVNVESWSAQACRMANRNFILEEWKQFSNDVSYRTICGALPMHPSVIQTILDEAKRSIDRGANQTAEAKYQEAAQLAITTDDARLNNNVCWFGSIDGFVKLVMPTCEREIALVPRGGWIRDTRGLARALLGDYEGAIEDFTYFVEWSKGRPDYQQYMSTREKWIEALQAGNNPFDEAELKRLRNEN